jgi:hypothetical protein
MSIISTLPPLFAAGLALALVLLLIWLGARLAPTLLGSRVPGSAGVLAMTRRGAAPARHG